MVAALDQGVSSPVLLPLRRMITTFVFVVGLVVFVIAFVVACSGTPEPVRPAQQAGETPSADADSPDGDDPDDRSSPDRVDDDLPDDEPALNLEDQVEETVTLSVGEHVEDAAGNVVVVYEIAPWPAAYRRADAFGSDDLELVGGIEDAFGEVESLVAIDVGMCAPGDFQESVEGQARFAIAGSPTEPLTAELSDPVKTGHPILEPHFEMPDPAACSRGWMVIGSTQAIAAGEAPVARYVLSGGQAESGGSDLLYQWLADTPAQVPSGLEPFSSGETVTFNEGLLSGATIRVNGWTELLNSDSPVPETRLIGVSLDVCPQDRWPQFGLSVDGWNLAGQVDQVDQLGFELADGHEPGECYSGWLDFVVPVGGVPSGFFASDGGDSLTGFASWSLDGAALPAPE